MPFTWAMLRNAEPEYFDDHEDSRELAVSVAATIGPA